MRKLPPILIGVLGYTGSGKSSLINALVEQETIVPCNAMRASTSVVVEIGYNESEDPERAFVAEVEFVRPAEWADEFEILAGDIKNRPSSEQLTMNAGTDASLAYAKLAAVYPGIPISRLLDMTPDELEMERDLSKVLGNSISIYKPTAPKFSEAVNAYIDSSNKGTDTDEFAYWPLVRLVKVSIKSDLLKHGLVLVDLPGLGDSNVGRTQVAENYIKKLRHMWVVADIVRAIDDRVANELMSRSFKRQLLMDGRYHENFVTFIMTKTDQLTTHEVIQSLNLDTSALKSEVAQEIQLTNQLKELKDQLSQAKQDQRLCKKALKKLADAGHSDNSTSREINKRTYAQVESEVDAPQVSDDLQKLVTNVDAAIAAETDLNGKVSKVKKAISSLNNKMKAICISERNGYTQKHLAQDFQTGLGQLKEELEAAGGEVDYPELQGTFALINIAQS